MIYFEQNSKSITEPFKDSGRETLQQHRDKHTLIVFYTIINVIHIAPHYVIELVSQRVEKASNHTLRNTSDLQTMPLLTQLFLQLFCSINH